MNSATLDGAERNKNVTLFLTATVGVIKSLIDHLPLMLCSFTSSNERSRKDSVVRYAEYYAND